MQAPEIYITRPSERPVPLQQAPSRYAWKTQEQALDRKATLKNKMLQLRGLIELDVVVGSNGAVLEGTERKQWIDLRKERLRNAESELSAIRRFLRGDPAPSSRPAPLAPAATNPDLVSQLLARCYRLLTSLDEREVDLGDEGEAILSAMESVVPADVLLGEEGT
jgi:hypothetical protein